jgi:hypothetical protein
MQISSIYRMASNSLWPSFSCMLPDTCNLYSSCSKYCCISKTRTDVLLAQDPPPCDAIENIPTCRSFKDQTLKVKEHGTTPVRRVLVDNTRGKKSCQRTRTHTHTRCVSSQIDDPEFWLEKARRNVPHRVYIATQSCGAAACIDSREPDARASVRVVGERVLRLKCTGQLHTESSGQKRVQPSESNRKALILPRLRRGRRRSNLDRRRAVMRLALIRM